MIYLLGKHIEALCRELNNSDYSNFIFQIKKSSSSVYSNISEAQYPQILADMLSNFKIAGGFDYISTDRSL